MTFTIFGQVSGTTIISIKGSGSQELLINCKGLGNPQYACYVSLKAPI